MRCGYVRLPVKQEEINSISHYIRHHITTLCIRSTGMENCSSCKEIPFHNLPSEDEPAFPHQPSLAALESSAKTCHLCKLILLAAGELTLILKNERDGNADANPGGWAEYMSTKSPSGHLVTYKTDGGWNMPSGGMVSGTDYQGPTYMSPRELFPDDRKIRPWLFGSWWTLPTNPLVQLVGLGVRLGSTPLLVEAEGNTTDGVHLRGTYLRIRTDNSMGLLQVESTAGPRVVVTIE